MTVLDGEETRVFFGSPPEFGHACGSYGPRDVQARTVSDNKLAEQIEAAMILARGCKDEDGRMLFMRIPPALALAIIDMVKSADPLGWAAEVVEG